MSANTTSPKSIASLNTANSRYRFTKVYKDELTGEIMFGTWAMPSIPENFQPLIHEITADEVGRPDLISFRVYGDTELFWAIALRSGILFPFTETTSGRRLLCPNIQDIKSMKMPGVA